jgi:hypothetical protein
MKGLTLESYTDGRNNNLDVLRLFAAILEFISLIPDCLPDRY